MHGPKLVRRKCERVRPRDARLSSCQQDHPPVPTRMDAGSNLRAGSNLCALHRLALTLARARAPRMHARAHHRTVTYSHAHVRTHRERPRPNRLATQHISIAAAGRRSSHRKENKTRQ
eukprot:510654-Pleurochrysis_carterae.AAC.1